MTLNDYIKHLQETVADNPEIGNLEVVYAKDPEGNAFYKLDGQDGGVMRVESLSDYLLEPVFSDDDEDYGVECFCIN